MNNEKPKGTPLRSHAEILAEKMAIHEENRRKNFPERAAASAHPMQGVSALMGIKTPVDIGEKTAQGYDMSNYNPSDPGLQPVSRIDPTTGLYGPSELI